jgi:NAD-dependent deacetylase
MPETPETSCRRAAEILRAASSVFALTGAGVSAESGVPTFRDAQTGLWARLDPEALASPRGFAENPGLVWSWYMSRLQGVEEARPNEGHLALARLEESLGAGFSLFTQNVDDLHERAGSQRVSHLHGNIARFRCHDCAAPHALRAGRPVIEVNPEPTPISRIADVRLRGPSGVLLPRLLPCPGAIP